MDRPMHTARQAKEAREPRWLSDYPDTPARRRDRRAMMVLCLGAPAVFLGCASLIGAPDLGWMGTIVLYGLGIIHGMGILIVRALERGGYWQICPHCHRKQPAGYDRCICGYPDAR